MSYANGTDLNGAHREPLCPAQQSWHVSEQDHRVANSFSLLAGTISHQARHLSKQKRMMSSEEVSGLLNEIGSRIAAVGQLHRDIATQSEGLHLDLNEHLWNLCDGLIAGLGRPSQFELLQSATGRCAIRADKVLPVCLIVTEIVTNSLKHAHPAGVRGSITIGCQSEADGSVLVEVADDGVGLPEGFDPAVDGGLGSQTVNALAKQLGAEASFLSRPIGLRFRLRLPSSSVQ